MPAWQFYWPILGGVVPLAVLLYRFRRGVAAKARPCDISTWTQLTLRAKVHLTHNTSLYTFSLGEGLYLGLPTGQARALINGTEVVRNYTPVSADGRIGEFDLVIKGLLSKYIDGLRVGEAMEFRGPRGRYCYVPNGRKAIGMVAGGTGITPMLQVIRRICADAGDRTAVSLIYANITEEDIILRDELEGLAKAHGNFKLHLVLNVPPSGWTQGSGFVGPDLMRQHLPPLSAPDVQWLFCGPPPMMAALRKNVEQLGFGPVSALTAPTDPVFVF